MWTLILMMSMLLCIKGSEMPDEEFTVNSQHLPVDRLAKEKEVNLISYIDNFKQIISNYVNEQYQLTEGEIGKVHVVVEEFLKKLAFDLKDIMANNGKDWEVKRMEDGLPDDKFEEVKKKVVEEFADIEDKTADELMYRLRKNLYETKLKLDVVLKDSDKVNKEEQSPE